MGRKIEATYPDGGIVVAAYGTRDGKLIECITDQNGNSKLVSRDTRGNIVAVTEEGGITTTYRYDVVNQLVTVTDAAGNITSITYDTWGRRTSIDNPDTGKTIYQYDDAGNLIRKQTANLRRQNKWIHYVYNYKQVKMIDNPDSEDVYYQYGTAGDGHNGAGRVVEEKTGILSDSYWYGALGQVIKKERSIDGKTYRIQWQWDNFGRVRSINYSNGFSVYYAYDAGGQVGGVVGYCGSLRTDYVKAIHYDEYGSRTKVEYGNGVESTYRYDERMHRLVQLQTKQGDSTLQNIAYSYDRVGNILTRTENGIQMSDRTPKTITHRYSYDSLYRLVEAEGTIKENGDVVQSYSNAFTYNDIGNIMKKLQTVKVQGENDPLLTYNYMYSYTTNKPHAVTGINDNLTYRYDANGNMIAVYDTAKNYNRILYWDDDNRLTKTVDTQAGVSTVTQYAYDAKGMRIIKDGPYGKSIYVYTGYVLSQEYVESNHIFVGNTRVASIVKHKDETKPATYYYATDHLGSSSVLTTSTGSYHERIEYLPYGETWFEDAVNSNAYSTPYKFTGKELDKETGLYYFGARYYDARISMWVSTDKYLEQYLPLKGNDNITKLPGNGGVYTSINMDVYNYGNENPLRYIDPDGNSALDKILDYIRNIFTTSTVTQQQEDDALHGRGNYQSPLRGFDPEKGNGVTSDFGMRTRPGTKRTEPHVGVDIAASEGTPIYAAHSGIITYNTKIITDNNGNIIGGFGNYAVIRGAHGIETVYGHMTDESMALLPNGTQVQQGQLIGYVGKTGFATGPHLHFEVRHLYNGHNPFPAIPSYPVNPQMNQYIYYNPRRFLEYMMNR